MAMLPGRCKNEMFCSIGASGRVVHVPAEGPFACPVCGRPLGPPVVPPPSGLMGATMFGIGICIAVAVAFIGGAVLGIGGLWHEKPTVAHLGSEVVPPPRARHYAQLQAPPTLVVSPLARRGLIGHSIRPR